MGLVGEGLVGTKRQNSADDVLIDVYAKCTRSDHRNTRRSKAGIALLNRQDSHSKLSGPPLRSRLSPRLRRQQPAVLAAHECTMEQQQRRRPLWRWRPAKISRP